MCKGTQVFLSFLNYTCTEFTPHTVSNTCTNSTYAYMPRPILYIASVVFYAKHSVEFIDIYIYIKYIIYNIFPCLYCTPETSSRPSR